MNLPFKSLLRSADLEELGRAGEWNKFLMVKNDKLWLFFPLRAVYGQYFSISPKRIFTSLSPTERYWFKNYSYGPRRRAHLAVFWSIKRENRLLQHFHRKYFFSALSGVEIENQCFRIGKLSFFHSLLRNRIEFVLCFHRWFAKNIAKRKAGKELCRSYFVRGRSRLSIYTGWLTTMKSFEIKFPRWKNGVEEGGSVMGLPSQRENYFRWWLKISRCSIRVMKEGAFDMYFFLNS